MIINTPNNETLVLEETRYNQILCAFLDTRSYCPSTGKTWGHPFEQVAIPIALSDCEHSYTICNECIGSWSIDYDFAELSVT